MTECYVGTYRASTKRAPSSPNSATSGWSCCSPRSRTHYVSLNSSQALQEHLPSQMISQLQRRSMVVKRLKVFQIESIVRGYITGSAWSSYQENGTVCGRGLPPGLQESEKLQQPLWTPCTKAEVGGKDENISPAEGW